MAKTNGYIQNGKRQYVHRLVAEAIVNRKLFPEEVVHHIDGNRSNNILENLIIFKTTADHSRYHRTGIKLKVEDRTYIAPLQKYILKNNCKICNKACKRIYCSYECSHIAQRVVEWPTKEQLSNDIETKIPFTTLGKKYGVSDNAVRK